jgi:putative oxidoreductase
MGYCNKYVKGYGDMMYLLFRLLVGLLFTVHGYQKLFVNGANLASLMGVAGVVELLAGLAIAFGFLTRLAATGGIITMLVAFFKVHAAKGLNPFANGGELALLYLAAFIALTIFGARRWNLDKVLFKKELF